MKPVDLEGEEYLALELAVERDRRLKRKGRRVPIEEMVVGLFPVLVMFACGFLAVAKLTAPAPGERSTRGPPSITASRASGSLTTIGNPGYAVATAPVPRGSTCTAEWYNPRIFATASVTGSTLTITTSEPTEVRYICFSQF